MKKSLLSILFLIPLFGYCQGIAKIDNQDKIVAAYDLPIPSKNDDKESVRILRAYLERKDQSLADVNNQINSYTSEASRYFIDTESADMYIRYVEDSEKIKDIDGAKKILNKMNWTTEIDAITKKSDLHIINGNIQYKKNKYINALMMLNKLADKKDTIIEEISLAHTRIDTLYNALFDEGKFRLNVTILFSCIIGSLLILFFALIYLKSGPDIAEDFLSSGNGLQFITLFCIIIAIILFGVMGILEGKELAAILSGISGYILGKGISNQPKTTAVEKNSKPEN